MKKLLLIITIALSVGFSGCSKDSSTKADNDYANGVMKGDVVEFKIIPGSSSSETLNLVIYAIGYQNTASANDYRIPGATSTTFYKGTATQDYQPVQFSIIDLYTTSKTTFQILVNRKVVREGYTDSTISTCNLLIGKI